MDLNFNNYPLIMGIVNVTPDSFSDGGEFYGLQNAVDQAEKLIDDGADIIDIGGESTRPGSDSVSVEQELERVIPLIEAIRNKNKNIPISVDSTKYEVVNQAIEAGADIINDISGLNYDPKIAELAAKYNKWLVIMHMKGTPKNMQKNPEYINPVKEIFDELKNRIEFARDKGVKKIIADVGIGFGKKYEHNIELLKNHSKFKELNVPLLLGISRKSFIGEMLGIKNPKNRDFSTVLFHALLIGQNTDVIRVHDVSSHAVLKNIFNKIKKL